MDLPLHFATAWIGVVILERSYHTLAITWYIMKMGNSFLGTHLKKILIVRLVLPPML